MKYTFIILLVLVSTTFAEQYTTEDLMRDTLAQADIDMKHFGFVSNSTFITYEQRATNQPAEIHSSAILALGVLADTYPESDYVFAYTLVDGNPVLVTFAKADDVNAFTNGEMSSEEFSSKVGYRIIAFTNDSSIDEPGPEPQPGPEPLPINCNASLFILGAILSAAFLGKIS